MLLGACLLPPAGRTHPATECQGRGGESCSSPMCRCRVCAASCRLERKSLGIAVGCRIGGVGLRELRRLWVRLPLRSCVLPLLTAAVSGQQAPAPTTAMPAVQRIAEVIVQSPISPKDSRGNCSKSNKSKG